MNFRVYYPSLGGNQKARRQSKSASYRKALHKNTAKLLIISVVLQLTACVSNKVNEPSAVTSYQQALADRGPQERLDTEGRDELEPLGLLRPILSKTETSPEVETEKDPDSEKTGSGVTKPVSSRVGAVPQVLNIIDPNTGQRIILGCGSVPAANLRPIKSPKEVMSDDVTAKSRNVPVGKAEELASNREQLHESEESFNGVLPNLDIEADPNTGLNSINLTVEQAVTRTLANSPEIRVVSFDPSIAQQDVTKAAAEFDITAFGSMNFQDEDNPPNSIFQAGESDVRAFETGIKQKGIIGSEWSLSYGLNRTWDDLIGRALATRYEPMLGFQLKQPLLRDAGREVTLAGVDIAKLNYKIALQGFRQKAEETAVKVISAYWRLLQSRRDLEIQQELLDRANETLKKVKGRSEIDATDIQIKQTEASAKAREAALLEASKALSDAQDALVRFMSDVQLTVLDEFQIVPVSSPSLESKGLDRSELLEIAMQNNPVIQQAKIALDISDINIRVAKNQDMPRLDLIASARTQALARGRNAAEDMLETGEYYSYAIGLSLEYPLGNRQREAEMIKRRLERRQSISVLQNVADQVAIAAKEEARRVETNFSEITIHKSAVEAARIHLRTLEDSEPLRERLTPEFLLVKLQAQEALASAQRAEIRSVVDFSISQAQLSQVLGTVLELNQVSDSLQLVSNDNDVSK